MWTNGSLLFQNLAAASRKPRRGSSYYEGRPRMEGNIFRASGLSLSCSVILNSKFLDVAIDAFILAGWWERLQHRALGDPHVRGAVQPSAPWRVGQPAIWPPKVPLSAAESACRSATCELLNSACKCLILKSSLDLMLPCVESLPEFELHSGSVTQYLNNCTNIVIRLQNIFKHLSSLSINLEFVKL